VIYCFGGGRRRTRRWSGDDDYNMFILRVKMLSSLVDTDGARSIISNIFLSVIVLIINKLT